MEDLNNKNLESYLKKVRENLKEVENETGSIVEQTQKDLNSKIKLTDFVKKQFLVSNDIGLTYDGRKGKIKIYCKTGNKKRTIAIDAEEKYYYEFLRKFKIDPDKKYSDSKWWYSESGDIVRCYSMNKPLSAYPNVTFSISKNPSEYHVDPEIKPFLKSFANSNILVVGGTGSGKTTFLNQILHSTKDDSRIAFVEEFRELFPPNDNTFFLEVPEEVPGEQYLFDFIIRKTNLMRINKLYVGEIKGPEAFSFVNNLNAGIIGGTTVHGGGCIEGLNRTKILMASAGICSEEICGEILAKSIDYVIYLENYVVKDIQKLEGVYSKNTGAFRTQNIL